MDSGTGFAGYRYWMACTPYPHFLDRLENPTIRVSNDGIEWRPLPGGPDPVFAPPEAVNEHWSDTDLVLADGQLHLYFRHCTQGGKNPSIVVSTTRDGIEWSSPRAVLRGPSLLSPAVVTDEGHWYLWCVAFEGSSAALWRHSGSRFDVFDNAIRCELQIPGFVLWHLDVIKTEDGYEALACAYPQGQDASHSRLFHLQSDDGLVFVLTRSEPIIAPKHGSWASRMIYRSTFQKSGDGRYRIWYSGSSWTRVTGIGLAEGPLDALDYSVGPAARISNADRARDRVLNAIWKLDQHTTTRWLSSGIDRCVRSLATLRGSIRAHSEQR